MSIKPVIDQSTFRRRQGALSPSAPDNQPIALGLLGALGPFTGLAYPAQIDDFAHGLTQVFLRNASIETTFASFASSATGSPASSRD